MDLILAAIPFFFLLIFIELAYGIVRGKNTRVGRSAGRKKNWKKAYVTLGEGETIEFFEGV